MSKVMDKKWIAVAVLVVILLVFSIPVLMRACGSSEETPGSSQSHAVTVVHGDLRTTVSAYGRISMPHQARLTFSIGGGASSIDLINVNLGDRVPEGFMLARLDATPFEMAVELAENNLDMAELALAASNGSAGQQLLVDNAEMALDEAERQLDATIMKAPFDGTVSEVYALVGDYVTAITPILTLVDTDETEAIAMIDEVDVDKVEPGQIALVTIDAIPEAAISGYVLAVSPQATIELGVVTFRATININPDPGINLRDGMTARIDIVVASENDVLLVPNSAITRKGTSRVVQMVTADGKTEERIVTIGKSNSTSTQILSGLNEGDQVMVPGQ